MAAVNRLKPMLHPYQLKLFLSNKYAYAQIAKQVGESHAIVLAASTVEKKLSQGMANKVDKEACARVGQILAQRASEAGIDKVQWIRKRGQRYHGRVASLIDSLRSTGLALM